MSVLVVVVMVMVLPGVVVLLVERGRVGAEALPLLLGLLQDPAVRQCAEPAQQLTVHLGQDGGEPEVERGQAETKA